MIADFIIYRMGWSDIWMPHAGFRGAWCWLTFSRRSRWVVGTWTGPEGDLLCVKKCKTNVEAERHLSPGGPTLTLAAIFAVGVYCGWLRTDPGGRVVWPWSRRRATP